MAPMKKRFNYRMDFIFATVCALAAFLPPFMLGRNGFLIFDFSVVVDAGSAMRVPANLSLEQAAAGERPGP